MSAAQQPRVYFLATPDDQPPYGWDWPNFTFNELASKDGAGLLLDTAAVNLLQRLRWLIGAPIIVHSGYRSIAHNREVGGEPSSYHLSGRAFDISCPGLPLTQLGEKAVNIGFTGLGLYDTFVHVDTGPLRRW